MKKLMSVTLGLTLLLALFSFKPNQRIGKWEKLGNKVINMIADRDVLQVRAHEGVFTKVKFAVRKAPIHINNIRIVFGNGNDKNIVINRKFAPGTESRVIDLPGNKRMIKKIIFNYKTVPAGRGRAYIAAWGRH